MLYRLVCASGDLFRDKVNSMNLYGTKRKFMHSHNFNEKGVRGFIVRYQVTFVEKEERSDLCESY